MTMKTRPSPKPAAAASLPLRATKPTTPSPKPPPRPKSQESLPSLLARVRARALKRQAVFTEAIWKDPSGNPVKCAKIHEVESDFLDRARAAGIPAVLLAPYGTGKTEGGLAYCLRLLDEDPSLRLGIVCDKDEHAVDRAQVLLRYIETDEDHLALFPEVVVDHGQRGRRTLYKFRLKQTRGKDAAVEASGIFASGTGSRKDIFFFDDVVTKQNAINEPAQRDRIKQAFFGTWLSRREPENSWWFYIGTTYHAADLTTALRESKDFAVMVIGVAENFKHYEVEERWPGKEPAEYTIPLWEPKWCEANLRKRYAEMSASGDTVEWMTGYRNLVIDPSRASFKEAWFRRAYHPVANPQGFKVSLRPSDYAYRVIFADPATTQNKRSDFYAGWVLGWDPKLNAAVVLDGWYVKQALTERVKTYLDCVEKWAPHKCGIEGRHEISFGERIEEVALDQQMGVKLVKLDREIDKDARIGALAPVMERGRVLVDADKYPWIVPEAQLWPNAKHDDALDALEGAWTLMRKWLRRGHRIPKTFDLDAQYARTPGLSREREFAPVPSRRTAGEELFDMGGSADDGFFGLG